MPSLTLTPKGRGRIGWIGSVLGICVCALAALPARGADSEDRLTRFKAVFLFNFIDYVHWPEERTAGAFKVGILGSSPLELPLREIAKKRKAWGHPFQIEVFDDVERLRPCHMLFISSGFSTQVAELSTRLSKSNVLTVAEAPGMAAQGASINFVLHEDKLRFEVNRESLARSGLRASAQLLKLAILVPPAATSDGSGNR